MNRAQAPHNPGALQAQGALDIRESTNMTTTSYVFLPPEKLTGTKGNDWIASSGTRTAEIHGDDGNDFLFGSDSFNDTLYGDGNSDHLYGYGGNDLLIGDNWNNIGNDLLNGGAGNDTLRGGSGNDTLVGGADRDMFQFDLWNDGAGMQWYGGGPSTADQIVDFQAGQDHVLINGSSTHNFQVQYPLDHGAVTMPNGYVGLIFDATRNDLWYDFGSGNGLVQLAHLNSSVSASDITWG
jgi:Ca2+-binding RTX toxin-like protein